MSGSIDISPQLHSAPGGPKNTDKKQRIADSWSPSVLQGKNRTDKKNRQYQTKKTENTRQLESWCTSGPEKNRQKNRQYQTAGVLVYFEARKEHTKRTDNTRQLES